MCGISHNLRDIQFPYSSKRQKQENSEEFKDMVPSVIYFGGWSMSKVVKLGNRLFPIKILH